MYSSSLKTIFLVNQQKCTTLILNVHTGFTLTLFYLQVKLCVVTGYGQVDVLVSLEYFLHKSWRRSMPAAAGRVQVQQYGKMYH